MIVELKSLENEGLTIYEILLSFLRRKELIILNRKSSSAEDLINNNDKSFDILDKYYNDIKDFIEQLRMIIEENEYSKIESM
jgi:HPt (histidine-containing phosphotransfer) domain-containing protein